MPKEARDVPRRSSGGAANQRVKLRSQTRLTRTGPLCRPKRLCQTFDARQIQVRNQSVCTFVITLSGKHEHVWGTAFLPCIVVENDVPKSCTRVHTLALEWASYNKTFEADAVRRSVLTLYCPFPIGLGCAQYSIEC